VITGSTGRVVIKTSKVGFSERFEQEVRAVAALNHPFICTLYDLDPDYRVMEFVEGTTLKRSAAVGEGAQVCRANPGSPDAAHRKSITHRDLKPANILATKQGIKLLDFTLT